jgi:CMP-N-acetylneuraminic acid synthetase
MTVRRIALIPAKGASQRFPRKNVALLGGRTLLERAVTAAKESGVFERIVVSTEEDDIAQIARDAGADVPFLRPAELSRDPATIFDVVRYTLDRLAEAGEEYDVVAILLPTAPLRTAQDVAGAVNAHAAAGLPLLTTITQWEHTPLNAYVRRADGSLTMLHPDYAGRLGARATQLPALVRLNGAVTVVSVAYVRAGKTINDSPAASYEMPPERSVDVDSEHDLKLAEFFLQRS